MNTAVNPQHAATKNETPLYEQVITLLLNSDEVVAPRPNVYPVHTVYNREAIIPPMCYTRTESKIIRATYATRMQDLAEKT